MMSVHAEPLQPQELPSMLRFPSVEKTSREALICFQQGLEQLQAGDAQEALPTLCRSVQNAPEFSEAHVLLGLAYALTYNIYPAIDHLELAAQLQPDSFAAHYTLAQLNFKLRIPQRGYASAERALTCVQTLEQRKMLAQLLREERARAQNGIARPWFHKRFSRPGLSVVGSGLATAIVAVILHFH
jgi:tetratricopeptide (TPR) repeat protein